MSGERLGPGHLRLASEQSWAQAIGQLLREDRAEEEAIRNGHVQEEATPQE